MYFVLRGQDFDALLVFLQTSSKRFWAIGFSLVVFYIALESVIIHYLLMSFGEKPRFTHCLLYSFVGFFFSLVTPAAMAGQPMQLVFMKRDGLSMSRSIITLLLVAMTFKLALVIIGIIVLVFRPASVMPFLNPAMPWILLGMVLNSVCVAGMLALVLVPSIAKSVVFAGIRIAERFVGHERAAHWRSDMAESLERYHQLSIFLRSHIRVGVVVTLLTILQRCLLFAITYLVLVSFGITSLNVIETVLMQGSISLSADMLPLPGGLGISEHLYEIIFGPVCGAGLTTPSLMISRGLSFYAQLLVSALFTGVAYVVIFGLRTSEMSEEERQTSRVFPRESTE